MSEADIAELIAETLNWAVAQAQNPFIFAVEPYGTGVVEFDTVEGQRFRLTVTRLTGDEA